MMGGRVIEANTDFIDNLLPSAACQRMNDKKRLRTACNLQSNKM